MTAAADLKGTIQLERVRIERNGLGEAVETWETLATRSAERADVSDAEAMRAAEVGSQLTTRFRIRYSSQVATVNARDRLIFEGETYNIVGVKETKRRRFIEISAVRRSDVAALPAGSP